MANVLEVKELSKQYSKVLAADKVSFEIGEGEIFALIGPNGAGKTTTIRMISTLLQPTSGDAVVAGHSILKAPEKVRESITYLPDEAGAYKQMTGIKYLRFMAGLFTTDIDTLNGYVDRAKNICGLGAVVMMVGYKYDKFRVAYSYDLTISKLSNSTYGAHEVSVAYTFGCHEKAKKISTISCPSF